MTWAFSLITEAAIHAHPVPRQASRFPRTRALGSTTTPLPMTQVTARAEYAGGDQVQDDARAARVDGVAGRCGRPGSVATTEKCGVSRSTILPLALVAPLAPTTAMFTTVALPKLSRAGRWRCGLAKQIMLTDEERTGKGNP